MNLTTLKRANELSRKIDQLKTALDTFEWSEYYGGGSKNPKIIIEHDGCDGRETHILPMLMSDNLLIVLKQEINKNLAEALREFDEL